MAPRRTTGGSRTRPRPRPLKLTPNVVKVYSPDATWPNVKAALQGASVVVYLGHGNGWPSIYRDALYPPTQNGFGLNPHAGAADSHQYFGEEQIGDEIKLAQDAVVIFSHLCYASGNTEPGLAEGTLAQAQQRVDNYAAGFFRAGAGAVIADAYLAPDLLREVGPAREALDRLDLEERPEPQRPLPALREPADARARSPRWTPTASTRASIARSSSRPG